MMNTTPAVEAQNDAPLTLEQLVHHFHLGSKTEDSFRVGLEHEKIGVVRGGRPLPYEDADPAAPQIRNLLAAFQARGWAATEEHGKVIALAKDRASITLEPGGQFELSGPPLPTAVAAVQHLDAHMAELLPIADQMGITFLACGFRPLGTWDDVPWMPKGRYRVMRSYLPTRGKLGVEMMKRTATVQANLDYKSEADALRKMRISLGLAPLVTAMFAASPLKDGKPCGMQSVRASCWLDTDPDRCGILPFLFEGEELFRPYTEWALDVPMFFIYRDHSYQPVPADLTFRRFWKEGHAGQRATLDDWDLHLSTLFPETRLKRYVEMRSADSGPMEMIRALPCLWRGLLYDEAASRAAWALCSDFTLEERQRLRAEVPWSGFATRVRDTDLGALSQELVDIAMEGLRALGSEEGMRLLQPLREQVRARRTPADAILEAYHQAQGDEQRFVEAIRYRL